MANKTVVYALSEQGYSPNEKGTEYIMGTMKEKYHVDENILIMSGTEINNPTHLKELLSQDENPYVMIYQDDGTATWMPPDTIQYLVQNLKRAKPGSKDTSWYIAMVTCGNIKE